MLYVYQHKFFFIFRLPEKTSCFLKKQTLHSSFMLLLKAIFVSNKTLSKPWSKTANKYLYRR